MPFAYYDRLSRASQRAYDQSDALPRVPLEVSAPRTALVARLARALGRGQRRQTEQLSRGLCRDITDSLSMPPVRIRVLAARPADDWGELQGLYEPGEGRAWATLTVWMRTAQRKQVVAFRTYLRTLLHELNHHLDYELFDLADSFHTEGFYKRESSMFHTLVAGLPDTLLGPGRRAKTATKAKTPARASQQQPQQLALSISPRTRGRR